MKNNIIEVYKEVKNNYDSLIDVDELNLIEIQKQAELDKKKKNTDTYLIAICVATLLFLIFPFVITEIYTFLDIITKNVIPFTASFTSGFITTLNFSLGIGCFALLAYIYLIPSKIFPFSKSTEKFNSVNKKQKNFIIISIIGTYVSIGIISILLYLNLESTRIFIGENFKYYLIIPFFFISLFLVMFFLLMLISPFTKSTKQHFDFSNNTRYEITYKLLNVLKTLSKVENIYIFPNSDFKSTIRELEEVDLLIYKFPSLFYKSQNSNLTEEFKKSSYAFQNVIADIMYTQEADLLLVKKKLVYYTNIFINGNLSNLPKSEIINEEANGKKAKLIHYILLGVYLTLPIIVIVLLKSVFKIEIDNYAQSLLKILYIIWAFIGIFSNPFIINNDNKEIIRDIIKTITGK